jgi:ferric-dicitrate binding protein FerR (iron transport regulator)
MPPAADVLIALADAEESEQARSTPIVVDEGTAPGGLSAARPHRRWWTAAKMAALAAGLVGLGLGLGEMLRPEAAPSLPLAEGQITTGDGERTTVVLGNGTSIRLGENSRLRMSHEGVATIAELDGRAFFGVKADSAHPFIVRTKYGEAVVHGTRFEVRSEEEEFRVLVVDGEVRVSTAGVVTDLSAGDAGLSLDGAPATTFRVDDVKRQLEWMGDALIFQGTPLWRAIEEIEGRYDVDVVLETPSLGDLTVTATFTDQEWDRVVLVLCEVVRAKCSIEGDKVRIRS